jgi:hypothetical protein
MEQLRIQEHEENQKEFREILSKYGLTQAEAAELITNETGQSVGTRKVRSWLARASIPSSRKCPNWALTALKRTTKELTEK